MEIYYLINLELGWDNVVSVATSPQKCIEDLTDGEIIPQTEQDVEDFLKTETVYRILDTILKE